MDPPSLSAPSRQLPSFNTQSIDIRSVLSIMESDESATPTDTTSESLTHVEPCQSNSSSRESSLVENNNHQELGQQSLYFQPGGILRSPSYASLACPSSPSITFAPLPAIDGRKRKKSIPLGVAARSRLLQQRRAKIEDGDLPPRHLWRDSDADDEVDPVAAFGHFVKGASKGLWRRVSLKEPKALKDNTASAMPTGIQEQSKERRCVVDVDRVVEGSKGDDEAGALEEDADVHQTTPHDSAQPSAQPQT